MKNKPVRMVAVSITFPDGYGKPAKITRRPVVVKVRHDSAPR